MRNGALWNKERFVFFFFGQICDKNMLNFYAKILRQIVGQKQGVDVILWFKFNGFYMILFSPKDCHDFQCDFCCRFRYSHYINTLHLQYFHWRLKTKIPLLFITPDDDGWLWNFLQVIYGIWLRWKWWEKMRFIQTNVLFFFSLYSRLSFFSSPLAHYIHIHFIRIGRCLAASFWMCSNKNVHSIESRLTRRAIQKQSK